MAPLFAYGVVNMHGMQSTQLFCPVPSVRSRKISRQPV